MNKKLFIIPIIALMISVGVASTVRANFFDDLLGFLKSPSSSTTSSSPSVSSTPPTPVIPLYKPAIDYENAVVHAVEVSSPSVVSIVISKDLPIIEQCPYNPFGDLPQGFGDFFGNGFQFSQPCQKGTKKQEVGGGSGFAVSNDGLIVTNKHVVTDMKADYTVLTNDGKKYNATVVARDATQDLALLRVSGVKLKPLTLGNSDSVKLGQTAIAIGNALGEFRNTVSVGVISGLARTITAGGQGVGSETIRGVMQTDAAINPGNSGGPLLNLKGEVIGVNTAIVSGAQNIGFSIPINTLKRAIDSVKKTGSIKSPYLGVRYIAINDEIKTKQKLSVNYGALVRGAEDGPAVVPQGPAAKGGVQAEDIILEIQGQKIDAEHELSTLIQKYDIGDVISLKIKRGDQTLILSVTLEERPVE